MRFTRKEIILTTITDEDITDINILRDLLKTIQRSSVDLIIDFKEPKTGFTKTHDKSRIMKVSEDDVDILVRQDKSIFNVKGVKITDIISIKIITSQNDFFVGSDANPFKFIDIEKE
jgi:hypothetical protein